MDNYIKTIINGLKAWVTNGLTRLEASVSKLSGNLDALGSKITSLNSKVTKNAKDIAELQEYENETYGIATEAQITANNAKTTANNAKTTANNAQITANNAKTTADNAKTTADNAQITADNAQITANTAKANAAVKWGKTMLGFDYDVSIINENISVGLAYSQLPTGTGNSAIYMLIASFMSGATKVSGITGVKMETDYASFGESVTIDAFDVIKIYRNVGETQWRAAKTGINLGGAISELDTAYQEGVDSL